MCIHVYDSRYYVESVGFDLDVIFESSSNLFSLRFKTILAQTGRLKSVVKEPEVPERVFAFLFFLLQTAKAQDMIQLFLFHFEHSEVPVAWLPGLWSLLWTLP